MKIFIRLFICAILLFSMGACVGGSLNPRLVEFSSSTIGVEEAVINIYNEMQSLEIEVRGEESTEKSSVSPENFKPKVFTFSTLKQREELMRALSDYSKSLLLIFEGNNSEITKNMELIKESFDSISARHPGLITKGEKGIIVTLSTAIPRALTAAKRRILMIKVMKKMQNIINKISYKLIAELESSSLLADNFFNRLFKERVEKRWPDKNIKRVKYSVMAVKLLKKSYLLRKRSSAVIKTLELLPKAHLAILRSINLKKDALNGIRDFIEYVYKLRKNYNSLLGE